MNTRDWENANAEQRNLWHIAQTLIVYTTITPVYYQGPAAGSEFVTYNAGKVYICLAFNYQWQGPASPLCEAINFHNMADVSTMQHLCAVPFWDVTAAVVKYTATMFLMNNFWFSRISYTYGGTLIFNGYRLNV